MRVSPITYSSGYSVRNINNSQSFTSLQTTSKETVSRLCDDRGYRALISTLKASVFKPKIDYWEEAFREYMIKADEFVSESAEFKVPNKVQFPVIKPFDSSVFNGIYSVINVNNGTYISSKNAGNKRLYRQIFIPDENMIALPKDSQGITVTEFEYIPEIDEYINKASTMYCNDGMQIIKQKNFFYTYGANGERQEAFFLHDTPKSKLTVVYDKDGNIHRKLYYNRTDKPVKVVTENYEHYFKKGKLFCSLDRNNNVFNADGYKIFEL